MSKLNFNMMDSAGYGFYRVWIERAYLLKLATIPLLIKFACMITVMVLDIEGNILRQGLILFPGVLAEGWVLAQFLRTLLKNERWPTILPADINDAILDKLLLRARGIVAATLAFGLIALASYMLRYLAFGLILGDFNATDEDVSNLLNAADADTSSKVSYEPSDVFPFDGDNRRFVLGIPYDVCLYSALCADACKRLSEGFGRHDGIGLKWLSYISVQWHLLCS